MCRIRQKNLQVENDVWIQNVRTIWSCTTLVTHRLVPRPTRVHTLATRPVSTFQLRIWHRGTESTLGGRLHNSVFMFIVFVPDGYNNECWARPMSG